jgi:hypothetical protein
VRGLAGRKECRADPSKLTAARSGRNPGYRNDRRVVRAIAAPVRPPLLLLTLVPTVRFRNGVSSIRPLASCSGRGGARRSGPVSSTSGLAHLATGIRIRACQAGHRVQFATASEWVDRLATAHHDGRLQDELCRLGRYPLLVIDFGSVRPEFGQVAPPGCGSLTCGDARV